MKDWYKEAFGDHYEDLYPLRNEEEALQHYPHLHQAAQLNQPLRILDCGCGNARYTQLFNQKGHHAIGLDLSSHLLGRAKESHPTPQLLRADMRSLPIKTSTFDRVFSLFTSFGYFHDDHNLLQISEMLRALKVNGLLYIDYLNPFTVYPSDWEDRTTNEIQIRSRKNIEITAGNVIKEIELTYPNGQKKKIEERVKLYDSMWFESAFNFIKGAKLIATWGDYQGNDLSKDSPRNIYLIQKVST